MSESEGRASCIGVMLVDDHAVVRSALRLLIDKQSNMKVVGEASNGEEALSVAEQERPEIIILDLCLGEENGIDFIPGLLKVVEGTEIIVLTGLKDEEEFRRAVRQGAMGVVNKKDPPELLMKAIERVHAGELWLNRGNTAKLITELRHSSNGKEPAAKTDLANRLTAREREIVSLVGEGLKNKEIADRLCISETTVRHHMTSILKKLNVSDRLELLVFAYRNNLVSIKQ
jgi:DNA-binding NarL/FixJ family response regulator